MLSLRIQGLVLSFCLFLSNMSFLQVDDDVVDDDDDDDDDDDGGGGGGGGEISVFTYLDTLETNQ